ncbi:MAG: DUF4240 domain-containing protein [Clostridiaceae bacterium]|nr:DUF4240 domain-containing protein [Clostridiaceae bacterium]
MDENIFWELIDQSLKESDGELSVQYEELLSVLSNVSVEEIIEFHKIFNKHYIESYTSDLWAAAYIINGGCSDDGFDYFRGWLISRGKDVFEKALKDPSSIADIIDIEEFEEAEFEEILYLADDAYTMKTNKKDFYDLVKPVKYTKIELAWSEDEGCLKKMFPRLVDMFWER